MYYHETSLKVKKLSYLPVSNLTVGQHAHELQELCWRWRVPNSWWSPRISGRLSQCFADTLWSVFTSCIKCALKNCPYRYIDLLKTLISGVHIEEEEQEEEVDNSVRGRLLRLLERVKKFREKKEEVESEPQEDKKPSKPFLLLTSNLVFITKFNMFKCKNDDYCT